MSYSAIDMSYESPAQGNKAVGALLGAAVGAVVGAVVLAAVVTVDRASSLYAPAATAVRPAVGLAGAIPSNGASYAQRSVAAASYSSVQQNVQSERMMLAQQPQTSSVYSWAFVLFAAVAGAVNGLFLWNSNKRVAMAATTGRREALMAGVAAAGMAAGPAFAAYGDAANVFGKAKDVEQFFEIKGDNWSGIMPGKYNKSKELEVPGIVGRWEDNFDAVNNGYVLERPGGLGSLDDVRNNIIAPLLGAQVFDGQSISEGGFAPGRYSSAAVLDQKQETKDGKTYYYYEFLTRTADGNEGGRHQLFVASASNGKVIVFKQQAGDKRWFKGLERPLRKSIEAFRVK